MFLTHACTCTLYTHAHTHTHTHTHTCSSGERSTWLGLVHSAGIFTLSALVGEQELFIKFSFVEWLFYPCSITVRPSLMTSSRYTFGFVFVRMREGGGGGIVLCFALVVINTRVHNPHAHKCIHIQYMYTHTHMHTFHHCCHCSGCSSRSAAITGGPCLPAQLDEYIPNVPLYR